MNDIFYDLIMKSLDMSNLLSYTYTQKSMSKLNLLDVCLHKDNKTILSKGYESHAITLCGTFIPLMHHYCFSVLDIIRQFWTKLDIFGLYWTFLVDKTGHYWTMFKIKSSISDELFYTCFL